MRYVAVLDTSVLLSGTVFGRTPKECIDLARHGTVEGVTCREILDERIDKLIQCYLMSSYQNIQIVLVSQFLALVQTR